MQYILAVPAARYGDFAEDLQKLHKGQDATQEWCAETAWGDSRLVVAHDPVAANRRTAARDDKVAELLKLGQQCSVKLDEQDESQRTGKKNKSKGRPMSDSGTKARFYHAVKDAHMAHVIKVDLKADLFSYTIDEDKKRYLELLDGKLLLVTNTHTAATEVVQRYKSLADIERGFRVLKSDIEIGPVYHRLPQRIRAHALVCFMALVLYRVMRMRLKAATEVRHPFGEIPVSPPRLANEFKDLPQFSGLNQIISVVARFSIQVVFISRSALHSASCLSRSPNREIAATPSWSSPFATSKANPVNAPSAPWVALRPVVKSTP